MDQAPEDQNRVFAWLNDLHSFLQELEQSEGDATEAIDSLDLPGSPLSIQGRSR